MVERRSIGSRIISMLLVACMLVGMIPATALPVFAADSTTATNVTTIRNYAANLLNSNFSKAASEDSDSSSDKFTWDTEGKKTNWRYYNGVMLDALLMLGVDSTAGNALEFAKDFLDTNTEDSDSKAVTHYITKEVDSVPPALVLFDVLNTAEVTDADRAIYVKAINYVYGQLEAQTSYSDCGGNLLHKMDNTSWATWNIGLDGIYMAQPFYMEYANALSQGKITNTVNSKTASDIYKEVYDRLMWVADKMYDSSTGLYHHGWCVADSKGNGHFWSRGIGWYAAGLVMCIDLMPEGSYKTDLIGKLGKLFDGMLQYQDDSGLWYNVVNRDSTLTDNNGNQLEASGTALMAYAMMKAYNEGWVTASKYATAAEKGFNGIVSAMESGKIVNIYKSSGVCTDDASYCANSYVSDEAKGVGPVLMAASEVSKYAGVEEVFNTGVVVAPVMAIAKGATSLSTTNGIKATLVSNHGTIKNVAPSALTFEVGDTSGSTATVTVKNGTYTIDTFQVDVVDTTGNQTVTGTFYVEEAVSGTPTAPSVTAGDWVEIKAPSTTTTGGSGNSYTFDPTHDIEDSFFTYPAGDFTSNRNYTYNGVTYTKGVQTDSSGYLEFTTTAAGTLTVYMSSGTAGRTQLLINTSDNNATVATFTVETKNVMSVYTVELEAGNTYRVKQGENTCYVVYANYTETGSGGTTTTIPGEYAKLNGTATYAYPTGTSTDIVAQIKSDYVVKSSADSNGTDAANVSWDDVTITWDKTLDVNTEGTYTATVIYGTKTLGTIPVLIYGGTVEVAYNVTLTVPSGFVADFEQAGQYVGYMGYSSAVTNGSGNSVSATYTVNVESADTGIATYNGGNNGGNINGQSVGSTNIVVSVDTVTYNGEDYAVTGAVANVPVVLNDKTWTSVTYQATGATLAPDTVELGKTTQAHGFAEASDGTTHSYGFTWTSGNTAVATVNSSTGVITPVSVGTATITGKLSKVDGEDYWNGNSVTVTVTVVAASGEEPEETTSATTEATDPVVEPTYTYDVKDGSGNALAGQTVTLNKGESITVSPYVLADGAEVSNYSVTLEATTNASAVTISGTTITANEVASDTTVTVKATITAPTKSASGGTATFTVNVKAATTSSTTGDAYELVTTVNTAKPYVIAEGTATIPHTVNTDTGKLTPIVVTWTEKDGQYIDTNNVVEEWYFESTGDADGSYYIYYLDGTTKYYFVCTSSSNYATTSTTASTKWLVNTVSGQTYINLVATEATGSSSRVNIGVADDGAKLESSTQKIYLYQKVSTCEHSYTSEVTTAATCTTTGVRTYTCSECGDTYTETIAATGHSYEDYECVNCDAHIHDYAITVTVQNNSMTAGTSQSMTATLTDNGNVVSDASYVWSIVNTDGTTYSGSSKLTGEQYKATNTLAAGSAAETFTVKVEAYDTVNGTITNVIDGAQIITVTAAGGSTGGNVYTHNFSSDKDGMTDNDNYFTISGNKTDNGGTIDGTTYDQGLKLQSSSGTVTFTAANAGTLTLHVGNSEATSVTIDGEKKSVTNGVVTVELAAGTHTIQKGDGEGYLYYIEYAEAGPAVTYTATLTLDSESGSMFVGNHWTLTPTVVITDSNGNTIDNATYTVNWSSDNSNVTVDSYGKVYAAGVASGAVVTGSISSITIDGTAYEVSASDACTFTTSIKTVSTGPVTAAAGNLVTFTVAGDIPSGSWGNIDNVKVYKDGTLVTTITDASCWNAPEGFTINGGALDLWMDGGGSGTATYGFIAETAGNYTVEYELIGDWTVTTDATITETLTAQTPTYTYELFAPDGTQLVNYPTHSVQVGDTWTPSLVVKASGIDVSDGYYITVNSSNDTAASESGDTITGLLANNTTTVDISIYKKDGTLVETKYSVCALSITEAPVEPWVDASTGWNTDYSDPYEITSDTQTWSYTSDTEETAADWWDVSHVTLYDSDGKEMAVIRADAYGWTYDPSTNTTAELVEVGSQTLNGATWLTSNKEGVTVKVTTKLDGDYIILVMATTDKNGTVLAENSYVLYNEGAGNPTIVFSGEECKLYGPDTTATDLDTAAAESAVDKLEALNLTVEVADLWIAKGQTGTASPVVKNGEDTITANVVYGVISGTSSTLSNGEFTANALGATNAIAYVNSVTVDGVVIPVTNVSATFVVNTIPWWEPKTTNTVTPNAGDTVTFTYGGNMPGVAKGAGYMDEVVIYKVDSNGNEEVVYSTNFDNGTENWTFENGFGDIQNSKDFNGDGTPEVWYSLRLYRSSGQAYQNLAASYSVTAEEGYSYYATYIEMIESVDGIGSMTGTMSVEAAQTVGSVYIHNFTEHGDISEFYTITGNLATNKGTATYNGETLTQCLKMESSTNVSFTAENAGTLTLVFGGDTDAAGKTVKIDGTSYTVGDDGTLTLDLAAGSHTITKGDSINLFYMAYAEVGSSGDSGGGSTGSTTSIRYELFTGTGADIVDGDVFVIVNAGKTIALMNDDDGDDSQIAGLSANASFDGNYVVLESGDEAYATWTVSGWKANTKDAGTYYQLNLGNGKRYIGDSDSKILKSSAKTLYIFPTSTPGLYALAGKAVESDGTYVASGNYWYYDTDSENWIRSETVGYVYLYKKTEVTSGVTVAEPGRLYIGATNSMPTVDLTETVTQNGSTLGSGDYSIAWSIVSGGEYIDLNTSTGLVTAKKGGTAVVRATVTVGSGDSAVTYTDDVTVTVVNPGVTVTEELSLIHGVDGSNTGSTNTVVSANNTDTNNYKVSYLSSNTGVVTVDEYGNITTVGKGTATVTATLTEVNGLNVSQLGISAATIVTVTEKEVANANLNSYDYVVHQGASDEDVQNALKHMVLSVLYNTGDSFTAQYGTDAKLTVDLSGVNTANVGIQYIPVTYTDDQGKVIFQDTVWLHVEEFDPSAYDGIVTEELNVTYVWDKDGVDVNKEYVIVADGYDIALLNPSATATTCGAAANGSVTVSGDTLTMNQSGASLAAWLIDTYVNASIGGNNVSRYNASNFLRYLGIDDDMMLIHYNVEHVYITHLGSGMYQIVLSYNDDGTPEYYLSYNGSQWTASTSPSSVRLFRKEASMQDYSINFELNPTETELPEGFTATLNTVVKYNNDTETLDSGSYQIVWTSSDPSVATVDQNGKVLGISTGTATITAKLVAVDGFKVVDNETDLPYIIETAEITVVSSDAEPVLTPSSLTIGVGSMPNLNKVNIVMSYGEGSEFNETVLHELLTFHLADAVGTLSDGTSVTGFSSAKPGVFTVQVEYAGNNYPLTIYVDEDPYAGLDVADSIPGYPDAGAVRMDKTATGVIDFNSTGLVKLELTAAGISTKSSVDVVLVVDVSNSMAWSMDWFSEEYYNSYVENYEATDDNPNPKSYDDWVKAARDPAKIPAVNDDKTINGATKLDMAMDSASDFANILLNVQGGDNTLTFVTFAGNDEEHGGQDGNMDSVRTPFVGVTDYNTAKGVFDATEFTHLVVDGNSVSYYLNIGGNTANGYGDPAVYGSYGSDGALKNRGNTNYDYAYGEATDAVADLKAQYKANTGKDYDTSGRQLYVVFMTDGAPSAYNGLFLNGKTSDTMFANTKGNGEDDKGDAYSKSDDANSESEWLTHIKGYHHLATALEEEIYGYYTVGFDLAHGGFGDYSWQEDDMQRVLSGMVKNSVVPVTMATDEAQLNAFYTNLAKALAYAGTNARVTDRIGDDFSLFTGVHMYDDNIVELTQGKEHELTADVFTQLGQMDFPVQILSYRLVLAADIGDELEVIDTDGTVKTVTVTEAHLGLRVNEAPQVIETITFHYDEATGAVSAYSDVIGEDENILKTNVTMKSLAPNADGDYEQVTYATVIDANYFTYGSRAATVDGESISEESIQWKIGNITDREIAMSYYAYLEGSLDGQDVSEGMYQTNEYAYLEYIDILGDYVKRDYGIPEAAWGKAGVTVRFYLVNENGQFVNRAGATFDNPANRIFLDGRASYSTDLNNWLVDKEDLVIDALKALTAAGLGNNELYDPDLILTVITDYVSKQNGSVTITDFSKEGVGSLVFINDVMNDGSYVNTIIDIPVILRDLGMSVRPLADATVVMDYGKPMDISVFSDEEKAYVTGWPDYRNGDDSGTQYIYDMTVVGFAAYNSEFDQRSYVPQNGFSTTLTSDNGSYAVTSANGTTQVRFTPSRMLEEVETVFVVVKFQEYTIVNGGKGEATDQYYYMYKQLNILPATVMYYETDGNMQGEFVFSATGWTSAKDQNNNSGEAQDVYLEGSDLYGYDSSYGSDTGLSDQSAWKATGSHSYDQETKKYTYDTYVSFTFTGTGFDIIARTGANQGDIHVTYTNRETGASKTVAVINKGVNELYQIPVLSVKDLAFGTYDVTIGVCSAFDSTIDMLDRGNEFYFDAVRIYGPVQGTETFTEAVLNASEYSVKTHTISEFYAKDGELNSTVLEIGDLFVTGDDLDQAADAEIDGIVYLDDVGSLTEGNSATTVTVPELDDKGNALYEWVEYENDNGEVVKEYVPVTKELTAVETYQQRGPNHEVYLDAGNGIAFKVTVEDISKLEGIYVGAKRVSSGNAEMEVYVRGVEGNVVSSGTTVKEIATATAMYYGIDGAKNVFTEDGDKYSAYVIIRNAEDAASILSLTDLKICYTDGTSTQATISIDAVGARIASAYMLAGYQHVVALTKAADGNWYYTVDGVVDTTYVGLGENKYGIWYVQNGQIDFTYTGLAQIDGVTYYILKGAVSTSTSGLLKVDGQWLYFDQGVLDTEYVGLVANRYGTWYVENGAIDFTKTGLVQIGETLAYVRNGLLSSTYVGLIKSDDGRWLYVENGIVDFGYNGVAKNSSGWWYVENSTINFSYTGTVETESGTYNVRKGLVDIANPISK